MFSQEQNDTHERVYGYDPLLYNGRVYYFYPQPGTGGTQYLLDAFDTHGTITLRGVTYTNLTINYDIYNQLLVLKYKNAIGSASLIEISEAWLEKFDLEGRHFEILTGNDTTKRIYQVVGKGNDKILYFREKQMLLHNLEVSGLYYFSKVIKEMYVLSGKRLVKFSNNRSFIAAFSPSEKELIKKYLRKNNLNVKKANDFKMNELINYCNTLGGS